MSLLGKIIFYIMICLILSFIALIALFLALAFSRPSLSALSTFSKPIANLSRDHLLSCYIPLRTQSKVTVTWLRAGDKGVVYRYQNGAPKLQDQIAEFKGRTQLFPSALVHGNASMLIRNIRASDEGYYTCSISSSGGSGKVQIHLRTAAYSLPTFSHTEDSLSAAAYRWFPKPNVTWMTLDSEVLEGVTEYSGGLGDTVNVFSELPCPNQTGSYVLKLDNQLVMSYSTVALSGSELSQSSYFVFDSAPRPRPDLPLTLVTFALGCLCWTQL